MDNRLTTHKTQIPEGKVQFFESVEYLRENTVNSTKEILSDKEKLINLLKLFNETFSLREMATILKIDRNTVSVYMKKEEITEEKSKLFLENKEETILENIEEREKKDKEYNRKYLKMQEKLAFFNSKIIEKDLCVLMDLPLATLMGYKKGSIKQIGEEKLDKLINKIINIHNKYIEDLDNMKKTLNYLKNLLSSKEICIHFKFPKTTFSTFLEGGNIKYEYLQYFLDNKDEILKDYPNNIIQYNTEKNRVKYYLEGKKKIIPNYKDVCKKFNISQKAYKKLMNGENINYKYIKGIIENIDGDFLEKNNIKLKYLNRIKENDEFLSDFIHSKNNFDEIFFLNYSFFYKLFEIFSNKNRIKLVNKKFKVIDLIEDLYKTRDFGKLEKIEKLLI